MHNNHPLSTMICRIMLRAGVPFSGGAVPPGILRG
jgi:hypothetical protein